MRSSHLLCALVAFTGGIWCRSLLSASLPLIASIGCVGIFFIGARLCTRRGAYLYVGVFLLLFSLGMVRVALAPTTLPSPFLPLMGTDVAQEGRIVADPDVRETSQRVTIEVKQASAHTRFLAVLPLYPELTYGELVRVQGTLTYPAPFSTEGGREFAYDTFLAKDGIFGLFPRATIRVLAPAQGVGPRAQAYLYAGKHAFVRALERALPEPAASLGVGLIAGGKQGLGKTLLDAFTVAGLLPIIVLSGYNVMIVAETVLVAFRFLPKHVATLLAGVVIALFVLAAGGGASALRAGLMAGIALYARASGRAYDALRALLVVFVLMLLLNPLLLVYDPGFQFSFAATIGLILGSPLISMRLLSVKSVFLREIIASTIAAQLAVLPLLLYETGNLSIVSVLANVLVLPVVPLGMGLSAFAGVVALVLAPVATLGGLPAYLVLSYIIAVATFMAGLPFAHVIIPAFPFALVVLAYAGLAWVYLRIQKTPAPLQRGAGVVSRS